MKNLVIVGAFVTSAAFAAPKEKAPVNTDIYVCSGKLGDKTVSEKLPLLDKKTSAGSTKTITVAKQKVEILVVAGVAMDDYSFTKGIVLKQTNDGKVVAESQAGGQTQPEFIALKSETAQIACELHTN